MLLRHSVAGLSSEEASLTHDVAIDKGSALIETKDAAGKLLAEAHEGTVQVGRALGGAELLDAVA